MRGLLEAVNNSGKTLSAVLINPHRIFGSRDVQPLQSGLSRYEHLVNWYLMPGANLLIEISEEAARILKTMRPELSKPDQG